MEKKLSSGCKNGSCFKLTLSTHRLMMLWSFLHRLHVTILWMRIWLMRMMVKVHVLLLLHGKVSTVPHFHITGKMHVLAALHLDVSPAVALLDMHHLSLFHMNVHCILTRIKSVSLRRLMVCHELSILVLLVLVHFDVLVRVPHHLVINDRFHLHWRHLGLLLHHHFLLYHLWWEWHLSLVLVELTRVFVKLLLLLLVRHSLRHI